jgi:hypothetical protein
MGDSRGRSASKSAPILRGGTGPRREWASVWLLPEAAAAIGWRLSEPKFAHVKCWGGGPVAMALCEGRTSGAQNMSRPIAGAAGPWRADTEHPHAGAFK